jgi:hypothetical protein
MRFNGSADGGCRGGLRGVAGLTRPREMFWAMSGLMPGLVFGLVFGLTAGPVSAAGPRWFSGPRSAASTGTPENQAPYEPGVSPYATGIKQRPKYFVPPTNPRTPTWKMYGTPPGVVPGDWPSYAPLGFGGYRFPAVGSQAYR